MLSAMNDVGISISSDTNCKYHRAGFAGGEEGRGGEGEGESCKKNRAVAEEQG